MKIMELGIVDKSALAAVRSPDRLYIGGEWVTPSSDAMFDVIDSATEELFFRVAEARSRDMDRAVGAARTAFDEGPWPRLSHAERAGYMRALADGLRARTEDMAQIWPRQTGLPYASAKAGLATVPGVFDFYAGLAETYPWAEPMPPAAGGFGLLVREPVGVVAGIIPWNGPASLIAYKIAPALIAGCTVIVKASPEAPGEAYILAEAAEAAGLPAGVVNVVTADREVSEELVTDPRVDKIGFTGSTAAGRRIASLMGNRIGRFTLELGGKSAAVILDDYDIEAAAAAIGMAGCRMTGQVCTLLSRVIVPRSRHAAMTAALADVLAQVRVGDPFDDETQMGPLSTARHRDRVEGWIATGLREGADLVAGGGRPRHLDRGYFVEPTVLGNVDNSWSVAQNEIFGPVLAVVPVPDEAAAIRTANDTIYGLNASVFTNDPDRFYAVARQLRSGTVGHNAWRSDFSMAFGGFKQSGIGREGGREGLLPYLETKTLIMEQPPSRY